MGYSDSIQRSFILSEEHARKLKAFCKYHRITASQWLRLQIDELQVDNYSSLRDSIVRDSFKVQNFLGVYNEQEPIKEVISDGNGKKQALWYQKKFPWYKECLT